MYNHYLHSYNLQNPKKICRQHTCHKLSKNTIKTPTAPQLLTPTLSPRRLAAARPSLIGPRNLPDHRTARRQSRNRRKASRAITMRQLVGVGGRPGASNASRVKYARPVNGRGRKNRAGSHGESIIRPGRGGSSIGRARRFCSRNQISGYL